jgi:hypothetical protein
MAQPLSVIIVDKSGTLKTLCIKDYKEEELFKKCGFKKSENFMMHAEWNVKFEGKKYNVQVFAKTDGRANLENKYDFPPPIDTKLFFGSCAIVASIKNSDGSKKYTDLTLPLWNKIYEKLFGGFEDLALTTIEDDEEEDELANVPKEKKTKEGYLKDGFVVDGSDDESYTTCNSDEDIIENDSNEEETNINTEKDSDIILEDIGSELSEDKYDYSSDDL